MVHSVAFTEQPLALYEEVEQENERLVQLKNEDPIVVQDIINTSQALVNAAKEGDLEEMRGIVANAQQGEFLQDSMLRAFVHAVLHVSLEMVQAMVSWGIPLSHPKLSQSLHTVCESTTPENFGKAWRILRLLVKGNDWGNIDVDTPREVDGWTPLCIACASACLPLASKLLDLGASPNSITCSNETPLMLAKCTRDCDDDMQSQARSIIVNMLKHHGGQESWQSALKACRRKSRRQETICETDSDIPDDAEGAC